jgi:hypothetical protein
VLSDPLFASIDKSGAVWRYTSRTRTFSRAEVKMVRGKPGSLMMREITDPDELALDESQRERADRNWAWFELHAAAIYAQYVGKCICISACEVFAGDTSSEATAMAKTAHPDDDGRIIFRIPLEKAVRIYAH